MYIVVCLSANFKWRFECFSKKFKCLFMFPKSTSPARRSDRLRLLSHAERDQPLLQKSHYNNHILFLNKQMLRSQHSRWTLTALPLVRFFHNMTHLTIKLLITHNNL